MRGSLDMTSLLPNYNRDFHRKHLTRRCSRRLAGAIPFFFMITTLPQLPKLALARRD
jgi:hypothetical protein